MCRHFPQIWQDYDGEAEQAAAAASTSTTEPVQARREYVDIIVSDVRTEPSFSFAVQLLQPGGEFSTARPILTLCRAPEEIADFASTEHTQPSCPSSRSS